MPRPAERPDERFELPLSFAQERLWFLDQLDPGQATYNVPGAVRLAGRLSLPALAASLAAVVERHEALRTTFRAGADRPVQVFDPVSATPRPLPLVDLSGLPSAGREAAARRLGTDEAARPFDLVQGPLMRATLLRLAASGEEHALLAHPASHRLGRLVAGGLRERSRGLLSGRSRRSAGGFPPLPVQYADFAVWQRGWLAGVELERQLAWWREHLAGAPALLDLPADRPRPAVQRHRGGVVPLSLPGELVESLTALGRGAGAQATLFMTLLAGFSALLGRFAGVTDLVVGSPVANRQWVEIEGLIGFFVNTLALRADLSGEPGFAALLGRVREATLGAYAHQDVPFERLVEELAPQRSLGHSPLFQVILALQNAPLAPLALPGLTLEPLPTAPGAAKFDLTLTLTPATLGGSGAVGTLEYNRDLFDRTTAERLAGSFLRLLAAVAGAPEVSLGELPLLSAAEGHQLRREWNAAPGEHGWGDSLPRLLAARAAASPRALAVLGGGELLTYGQLQARAGRLAKRLRQLGVRAGSRVGLCLDRSPDLVVGLLATLAAGGAYVVLDPSYPAERLSLLVADSAAAVILTRSDLVDRLPEDGPAVLCLDQEKELPAEVDGPALDGANDLDDVLYVIYTSGSTGVPKGTAVYQRGFVNLLRWYVDEFGISAEDRFLIVTSAGFDLTQKNFFAPLLSGGLLVLADPAPYDPREIVATLERYQITRLNCTPSAFYPLLEEGGLERLSSLRSVFLGGEPIAAGRLAAWRQSVGRHTEVVNTYGPTECTDVVAFRRLSAADDGGPAPIGRALPGLRLLTLDRHLSPLPFGVAGQLAVGGVGVGAGYLGRPELTAEKFVPDPFAAEPGSRLYWTGDLARTLPGGEIDFLGRVDQQVKVRGFRIELGEVEAALAACPGVGGAAVLVRADRPGDRRLVAYVERASGVTVTGAELRAALGARLPAYMVPGSFVVLERLPLSANGKVDRRALAQIAPQMAQELAPEEAMYVAPRTPAEEKMAEIWGEVLSRERVGALDDFFALGGHSLLATRLMSRLRAAFGVEIPLRALFAQPTVRGLAGLAGSAATGTSPRRPVPRPRRRTEAPLSFAQERLWFLDQLEPGSAVYNVPALVRLRGVLRPAVLGAALNEIVRRHEVLRTTFARSGDRPIQVIAAERRIVLPLVDLAALPEPLRRATAEALTRAEARRPFDLGAGPLLRVLLVRLAAGVPAEPAEHVALLNLHHIVSDGWSTGVLIGELAALYAGFLAGKASPLPALPWQYADYALWQRELLAGPELERQLGWWREHLAGVPEALELPTDRPRPAVQSSRGAHLPFVLPAGLAAAVKSLSGESGATLFMTLLTAFQALLARLSGQEDLTVGSPIAGRRRTEVEGLIGFFVNTLVLRLDLTTGADRPGLRALLARTREIILGAFEHQDVPFERLVEELRPARQLARSPLFQVMFILQNDSTVPLSLPGLELSGVPVEVGIAKFDLTLALFEEKGRLAGSIEYNRDLFDAATIERMAGSFLRLLEAATAAPDLPLYELPLLAPAERHQLLREWNSAPGEPGWGATLPRLLAARAAASPGAPAVFGGGDGELLTYGQLQARAGRLALRLRQLGVRAGSRVGLCLERSPDLVVGLLATLGAGGAYVVLDPAYPAERLSFLLADSGAAVVLTRSDLVARLPENGPPVLCLDREVELAPTGDGSLLDGANAPEDLLYVIYTSGSTGMPKGAGVYQRGFVNLLRWYVEEFGLSAEDRFLVVTSAGFDLTQKNFFAPLLCGGLLVLADPAPYDPREIVATIERHRITRLNCTPSAFYPLLEAGELERLSSLRSVFLGGEPIAPARLASWRRSVGRHTEVVNTYGPTECTDVVAFHRLAFAEWRKTMFLDRLPSAARSPVSACWFWTAIWRRCRSGWLESFRSAVWE